MNNEKLIKELARQLGEVYDRLDESRAITVKLLASPKLNPPAHKAEHRGE